MRVLVAVLAVLALCVGVEASVSHNHFAACTTSVCTVVGDQGDAWTQVTLKYQEGVTDASAVATNAPPVVQGTNAVHAKKMNKMSPPTLGVAEFDTVTASPNAAYPTYVTWAVADINLEQFNELYSTIGSDPATYTSKPTYRFWASLYDPTQIGQAGQPATAAAWIAAARQNPLPTTYFDSVDAQYYNPSTTCVPPVITSDDVIVSQGTCVDSRLTAYRDGTGAIADKGWYPYSTGVPPNTQSGFYPFYVLENIAAPGEDSAFDVRQNTTPLCGGVGQPSCGAPPGGAGDPQFVGIQGQSYQFHGMADEVFNLISSPELQMNSLFKFISSGNCDYNETVCWSHPGTYLGQISIQFGDEHILFQSASHSTGMTVLVNDNQIAVSKHRHHYHSGNSTLTLSHSAAGVVEVSTDMFYFRIVNSDYFFNLDFGIKDQNIIQAGARHLSITGDICEKESHSVTNTRDGEVAAKIRATYPAIPIHGLIGQTWRNTVYCGRYFEGNVDDYVVGDIFGNGHTFNMFKVHSGH